MAANTTEWYCQLIDGRTGRPISDSTGKAFGITPGAGAKASLFSDEFGTALTQPLTFTNGIIRFWTAASVTALDVTGLTAKGHAFYIEDLTPSQHRYVIWPEAAQSTFALPYELNATITGGAVDSGVDLPDSVIVNDCYVDILVAATGGLLSIGTSAVTTGFFAAIPVSVTGTKGLDESVSAIIGSLLSLTATNFATRIRYRRSSATSGARIVYQDATATSTAGSGFIFFKLDRIASRG